MKPRYLLPPAIFTVALVLPLVVRSGVLNSPHDFSTASWNTAQAFPSDPNSVCGPCHQAHHTASAVVPLWGHDTAPANSFKMYSPATVPGSVMKATPDASPAGPSLACLSCHDGTVAVNQMAGGKVVGGPPVTVTNSARITTDANGVWQPGNLTHTHPISFTYDATLYTRDNGLYDPDTHQILVPDSSPFTIGTAASDKTINNFLLKGTHRVECTSCHDVHNQKGSPYDVNSNPKQVLISGTQGGKGSLLCRSCHNK
jgi:hypothetical protein